MTEFDIDMNIFSQAATQMLQVHVNGDTHFTTSMYFPIVPNT